MSYYVQRTARLVSLNLRSQRAELVSSICRPIRLAGLVGIPAQIVLLSCAILLWTLVFLLVPTLLICVWMALQPYRLWLFLRSRTTGNRFFH
jgi:hypothetical protein